MREHQIVITLKPEQFLEVQKQARAANAKSMGIFVRQKLLAALGIEGSLSAEQAESADVAPVLAELKRLHSELKLFVAESLSLYALEMPVDEALAQQADGVVIATNGTEPAAEAEDHSRFVESEDELERAAERAFAISPRLGPIGENGMVPVEQAAEPAAHVVENEAPPPTTVADMLKSDLHSRREFHHHGHTVATTFGAEDPLSKLLADDEEDPAVDEQTQSGSQIMAQYDDEDEDEELDVPLSLSERRRLLEQEETQHVSEEQSSEQISTAHHVPYEEEQPTVLDEDHTLAQEEQDPDPIAAETGMSTTTATTTHASDQDQNLKPSTGRPLGYPPFSGSPPPKRRQV